MALWHRDDFRAYAARAVTHHCILMSPRDKYVSFFFFFFLTQMGVKLQATDCLTRCQKFPAGSRSHRCGFSFSSPFQMNQLCQGGKKCCLFETIRTCVKLLPQLILLAARLCPAASYCFSTVIDCWEIDFPRVRAEACLREQQIWTEMADSS